MNIMFVSLNDFDSLDESSIYTDLLQEFIKTVRLKMKIAILANNDVGLYKFRKELIDRLLEQQCEVFLFLPDGKYINYFTKKGCHFINTLIERHGTNPVTDMGLMKLYKRELKRIKPDVVLTYTIKPNIYGGMSCESLNIPYIANITGLGTAVENGGVMQQLTIAMYKYAFRKVKCVFFQNTENRQFFIDHHIALGKHQLLPGSGVNLDQFSVLPYPEDETEIHFAFISRIMKEKGIDQYLETAQIIKIEYPNTFFHICGFCEEAYEQKLADLQAQGIIIYHGMVDDVREILLNMHAVVLPTFHEGMSNTLLEGAACGRPVIASNIPGCREIFDDNISGIGFESRNTEALVKAIEKFIALLYEQKEAMGKAGRKRVEQKFDRQIVVNAYMNEINKIVKEKDNGNN